MKIEKTTSWLGMVRKKYPNCTFVDGYKTGKDKNDNSFVTLVMQGLKQEASRYAYYAVTKEAAENSFYNEFNKYAHDCTEIHIRVEPESTKTPAWVPSVWTPSLKVELENLELWTTRGRFTFYNKDGIKTCREQGHTEIKDAKEET